MFSRVFAGSVFLLSLSQCFAASVATVSSKGSVTVSGIQVPTERLISWPISAADEIATASTPAVIRFADGSVLTLQRNSRVKLDSSPAKFSLVSGAAIYDGRPRTAVVGSTTKGSVNFAALNQANGAANTRYTAASATAEVVPPPASYSALYKAPGSQQYYVAPNAVTTGTFSLTGGSHADPGAGGGAEIALPSGSRIELTITTGANGQPVYTITSILVPVDVPGQPTQFLSITSGPLVGATVTVPNPTQGTSQPISITPAGSTTPLDPTQVATAIQTSSTTALQAAQASGQLPASATIQPTSPASVGTFSSSAP